MKTLRILTPLFFVLFLISSCTTTEKYKVESKTDANGYTYETVTNDPMKTRIYTLDNGLKVYLSVNKDAPRIQTLITVKAGSTYDPAETTGLAHYLEHLMFKGTDEIATQNWEKESELLQQISDLYEEHKNTDDPEKKTEIYAEIDRISGIAATYAIANEYDKMVSSIGAKGTNAGTSNELTVYMNDVPSNQFEKWLGLEKERFSELVLRLFHTELETVYEEFNMSQDNDYRKASFALMNGLFPTHPYGTQTTLGKAEHLKNPSWINIQNDWNYYYRPNNMAFCLAGDFDYDETIQLIDKYWGDFEPNAELKKPEFEKQAPITAPIEREVTGPEAEFMNMAFRFGGSKSDDVKYVTLIDNILSNSQAGLIDINLVQEQKVLSAGSYANFLNEYGMHVFNGRPRDGQTMEEVKDLLLAEIEKIKKGEFEDWILEAVINNFRLDEIRGAESNYRVWNFMSAFVAEKEWIDQLKFIDELEKVTKEELVAFANKHYNDNYVVVYKRQGEDDDAIKIEKPQITPVELNREAQSDWLTAFQEIETEKLQPVFVDFNKEINKSDLKDGVEFNYIKNTTNELFNLNYIIDMGKNHNKELPIAVNYLPYLGTDKYTAAELQQEFYKLGISMNVSTGNDRSYVSISGLDKNFEKGMELLEHVLANAQPDQVAYDNYVDGIIKKRENAKLSKGSIMGAMVNYGKYGAESSMTDIISADDLKAIDPATLVDLVKDIYSYEHTIFYYGPRAATAVEGTIGQFHVTPETLAEIPEEKDYPELDTDENVVYFVDYDMVQANIVTLSKDVQFSKELMPEARLFGEYYGSGLSSIVFQDIREAKGLAYTAFASYQLPSKPEDNFYTFTYVATQADKLKEASDAMLDLMNNMPKADIQFNSAKDAILTKIETERITKANIFWTYLSNKQKGIDYDIRKDVYNYTKDVDLDQFESFFNEHIANKNYTYVIISDRDRIDMNTMKKLGTVKELTLEELFGY